MGRSAKVGAEGRAAVLLLPGAEAFQEVLKEDAGEQAGIRDP